MRSRAQKKSLDCGVVNCSVHVNIFCAGGQCLCIQKPPAENVSTHARNFGTLMLPHYAFVCAGVELSVQGDWVHVHSKAAHRTCLDRNCFSMVHMRVTLLFRVPQQSPSLCVHSLLSLHTWYKEGCLFGCSCGANIFSRVCEIVELSGITIRAARDLLHTSVHSWAGAVTHAHIVNSCFHRHFYSTYVSASTH